MGRSTHVRIQLGVLSLAMILGMAPWFAATVVASSMGPSLGLGPAAQTWLTLAVQLGFVLGSVVSAALLLSDRLRARRLAAFSAGVAAAATALLTLPSVGTTSAIALRMLTGAALAGVYPPGIKIAAGWTEGRRGTAIGVLVGALTLGTAAPHLLRLVADLSQWRPVLYGAAASALGSAVIFGVVVREGPFQSPSAPFDPRALRRVLGDRGVMLATGGYLGHMWELYAMWSTLGLFLAAMVALHHGSAITAPLLAFAAIGVSGAAGCVVAGIWADRLGKSRVAIVAMAISGTCALMVGPVTSWSFPLGMALTLLWGGAVVADSAQFSASVTVLAPRDYVGTAVTMQTALGFLLTMLTIQLVPRWALLWGWKWAYAPLAVGPIMGIYAMRRLWKVRHV
jgi:MFS family permease